ncbi:hypothetical protein IE53DRAFT_246186 [Violaceomyces palustris]|uniref:Uncharacterized protein n=1 Tax=Violaceomyces palustris TaxID=1673888 RepID=A0ACD0P463_9BASI|nr:hypothetical protein IE53DRAFT_246186 [Violaceomyces palustris]
MPSNPEEETTPHPILFLFLLDPPVFSLSLSLSPSSTLRTKAPLVSPEPRSVDLTQRILHDSPSLIPPPDLSDLVIPGRIHNLLHHLASRIDLAYIHICICIRFFRFLLLIHVEIATCPLFFLYVRKLGRRAPALGFAPFLCTL